MTFAKIYRNIRTGQDKTGRSVVKPPVHPLPARNDMLYLTLWRPMLPYGYSYKAIICNFWHPGHSGHSDAQGWASECPDVKNYKCRHKMLKLYPYGSNERQGVKDTTKMPFSYFIPGVDSVYLFPYLTPFCPPATSIPCYSHSGYIWMDRKKLYSIVFLRHTIKMVHCRNFCEKSQRKIGH